MSLGRQSSRRPLAIAPLLALFAAVAVSQPNLQGWTELKQRVVNARQLIGSAVTNGVTPMGRVQDLLLTPDSTQVQHILFEVPYPASLWGARDGFVAFEESRIEHGLGFNLVVNFDEEESLRRPEELEVSPEVARQRLVSRILYQPIEFEDGVTLEIGDLLIDRRGGEVTHYVVETDASAVFESARRTVPADRVEVRDDGRRVASVRVDELDALQGFDPGLL